MSKINPIKKEENPKKKFISKDYKRPPLIQEPDNENVIIGHEIDTPAVRLDTVIDHLNNVTIEGYIFADIETIETKTGLRIMTLKITDETDSIYGKIFINDEEEFVTISKKLKKNTWYKFRGQTKDDTYSNELTFMPKDICKSNRKTEELIDDAPIKRVELHAHTMMSQMDGVTKLDLGKHTCELVEKTIKMGYKGVAITDHSGCQAFPISFGIIKNHNKGIRKGIKLMKKQMKKLKIIF